MQITPTDPNSAADPSARLPIQSLGQSDFLKLLATQLSMQDPMKPMTDTSFIAQMAQFSSLEQNKAMASDLSGLRSDQQIAQSDGLLGKTVSVKPAQGIAISGVVSAIQLDGGVAKLIVNGLSYDLSQVQTIWPNTLGK